MNITAESLQAMWDMMQRTPPPKPMRIVSHEVYNRAQEALADGAGAEEIEYILMGASREQAREFARRFEEPKK